MKNKTSSINRHKLLCLLTGIAGIYMTFCLGGLFHERLLKQPYIDRIDNT
jgi:hypothetical protein